MREDEAKLTIRLPRTLLERLRREAKADERSLNSLVVRVLSLAEYPRYRRSVLDPIREELPALMGPKATSGVGEISEEREKP